MFKALVALVLVFAVQVHAEEILDAGECSVPKAVESSDGSIKTSTILSYVGCDVPEGEQMWEGIRRKVEIALPGNSPRIEESVKQLCAGLQADLQKRYVHIEDSLCMKE